MEIVPFQYDGERRGVLVSLHVFDVTAVVGLNTQRRQDLDGAETIVVREQMHEQFANREQWANIADYRMLARRFPDASVVRLSSYDYQHILTDVHADQKDPVPRSDQRLLDAVRQSEMERFVLASNALMPSSAGYVYLLPSGLYASTFLRVGNIQTRTSVLDAVLFWMLPHLKDVGGILVDTWSISSIALNAVRQIRAYDESSGRAVGVEILPRYADQRRATANEIVDMAKRASRSFQDRFLLLFSANMSGRSLQRTVDVLTEAGCAPDRIRALALYDVGVRSENDGTVPSLCDRIVIDTTRDAPQDTAIIPIDENLYFPFGVTEETVEIRAPRHASPNLEFFNRYASSDAISVHADSSVGGQKYRHHGIALNVSVLLKTDAFQQKLKEVSEGLVPPDLILVPPHAPGRDLAKTCAACFCEPSNIEIIESVDLQEQHAIDRIKTLTADSVLMIVDDVVTTGNRLQIYQRRLRDPDVDYKGVIYYMVGVSRMPSEKEWQSLKRQLVWRKLEPNRVLAVETITLPDWDERLCPWCQESVILQAAIAKHARDASDVMRERASRLRSAGSSGLVDDVFISAPESPPLRLGNGSVFVAQEARQAVVVAAVSAALQNIRNDEDPKFRLDPQRFPVRSVLSIQEFKTYSDAVLRASILRCAYSREMRRADALKENERIVWARKTLLSEDPADIDVRREILIAVLLDRLPRSTLNEETLQHLRQGGLEEFVALFEQGAL